MRASGGAVMRFIGIASGSAAPAPSPGRIVRAAPLPACGPLGAAGCGRLCCRRSPARSRGIATTSQGRGSSGQVRRGPLCITSRELRTADSRPPGQLRQPGSRHVEGPRRGIRAASSSPTAVQERQRLRQPYPNYRVIVLDDNVNTFQHVVDCLVRHLPGMQPDRAWELAHRIDGEGSAVVWRGPQEQAELYHQLLGAEGLTMAPLERD